MAARRKKSKKRSAASSRSTPQPDRYEFFVDECVAPRHVSEILRVAGHIAHVQGPGTFGTGTYDIDWLPQVGARGWVLITKDKNIRKRELELCALRAAGVRAFVITAGGMKGEDQARIVATALPAMLRLLRRRAATFVARITAASDVEVIELAKYVSPDD